MIPHPDFGNGVPTVETRTCSGRHLPPYALALLLRAIKKAGGDAKEKNIRRDQRQSMNVVCRVEKNER